MATIHVYDETILPCITFPLDNTHEKSKRYLGNKALSGEIYANINLLPKNDTEMKALYDFWKDDCNYGLNPFLIPLPIFGRTGDLEYPCLQVKFVEEIKSVKVDLHWTVKIKLKVLGNVYYIVDDVEDYIIDDSGNYVVTDIETNSFKEITYGN